MSDVVAERPLVVLVEDIHWAEAQLLDLLEYVFATVHGPLLVIATARPELLERRPGWGARVGGELLELEPLSAQDALRMLDELLARRRSSIGARRRRAACAAPSAASRRDRRPSGTPHHGRT